jgi:hypothetical protein
MTQLIEFFVCVLCQIIVRHSHPPSFFPIISIVMASIAPYHFTSFARGGWGAAAPRHMIESILVWSDLHTLIAATKVCTEWRGAVKTMARGHCSLRTCVQSCTLLPTQGAIGKHITDANVSSNFLRISPTRYIEMLTTVAPFITYMNLSFDDADAHGIMNALARMQYLTDLTLCMSQLQLMCLEPLIRSQSLKNVCVYGIWLNDSEKHMIDCEIDIIRALGHLEVFVMPRQYFIKDNVQRILAQPHTIAWNIINRIQSVDIISLLPALPSLTELYTLSRILVPSVMASLPALTTLICTGTDGLDHALDNCRNLTRLQIILEKTSTLEWANTPSLQKSLQILSLLYFEDGLEIDPVQLRHLGHLKNLCTLEINTRAFAENIKWSNDLIALRPPSALLPKLQTLLLK